MATIRDKLGHCLHKLFTSPARVSSPSPEKRDLNDSRRGDLKWTPEIAHEAGFFSVFGGVPASSLVSAKANRGRVGRRMANPIPVGSGVGERRISSAWPFAESRISASQGYRESDVRANGPVCRESLPYPNLEHIITRIWSLPWLLRRGASGVVGDPSVNQCVKF
jgi:hypothetical protein